MPEQCDSLCASLISFGMTLQDLSSNTNLLDHASELEAPKQPVVELSDENGMNISKAQGETRVKDDA